MVNIKYRPWKTVLLQINHDFMYIVQWKLRHRDILGVKEIYSSFLPYWVCGLIPQNKEYFRFQGIFSHSFWVSLIPNIQYIERERELSEHATEYPMTWVLS